jgi:hypothetical protein
MKILVNSTDIPALDGLVWAAWPSSNQVYAAPVLGMGVVGAQRDGVNQWMNQSKLLPTDQVYSDTPNPVSTSTNWWPVSTVTFAPSATVAPAPFLLGTWGSTTNPPAAYKAGLAALMAKLALGVAMTVPQQQAFLLAAIGAYVLPVVPPVVVSAGNTAKLSWVNPTQNTDGTPLTDSAGSDIYQGPSATTMVKVAVVGPGVTHWESPPLAAGTYFFAVTDFNSASPSAESAQSPNVSTTIVPPVTTAKTPGAPATLKLSVTLTGSV